MTFEQKIKYLNHKYRKLPESPVSKILLKIKFYSLWYLKEERKRKASQKMTTAQFIAEIDQYVRDVERVCSRAAKEFNHKL